MNHFPAQANFSWQERASALVEVRWSSDATNIAGVVCPSVNSVSLLRPLSHAPCCALFRTAASSVWMLRTTGHVWTEERIATAAELLLSPTSKREATTPDASLETRLAYLLELPHVRVLRPVLTEVERSHWETRKLAVALRLQQLPEDAWVPEPALLAAEVELLESGLNSALRAAIHGFAEGLDHEVISVEPRSLVEIDLYNFLVQPTYRRNRLQFAKTFPLFVRAAATDGAGSLGGRIRSTVDAGLPLVSTLAKQWAVSPSVLRGLRQRPVDVVGARWESNIKSLVMALNALPAEFRPSQDPATWQAFNQCVGFAESVFGRRRWASPLALAWLRQAAKRGWTMQDIARASGDLQGSVALVDDLRQALVETLRAETGTPSTVGGDEVSHWARVTTSVDRYLSGIALRRLTELAQRFRQELAAARLEVADDMALILGTKFWPLLPEEHLSSDLSRVVVSLATPEEMMRLGLVLGNCLGTSSLAHYATACMNGEAFLLAVLEAESRVPLSAAELHVSKRDLAHRYEVRVVQHRAARNARPTTPCRAALSEVLSRLRSEPYQQHLRAVFRAIAERRRNELQSKQEAERLPVVRALHRALGRRRFESLVRALRCEEQSAGRSS